MTKEHYIRIIENYEFILAQAVVDATPMDQAFIAHAKEMCPKAIKHMEAGKVEKAMRWLGFIQGMMCRMGLRALGDLREDNKGDVQEKDEEEENQQADLQGVQP